jgi:hypothetical protein
MPDRRPLGQHNRKNKRQMRLELGHEFGSANFHRQRRGPAGKPATAGLADIPASHMAAILMP